MDDELIDLDDLPFREIDAAASPLTEPEPLAAPRRRSAARWLIPLLVLALAAGAGLAAHRYLLLHHALAFHTATGVWRPLEPLRAAEGPGGEVVTPFSGFAVSVETVPGGAVVAVQGVTRGEAPVLADVDCARGEPVVITARKAGWAPATATVTCRRDALVRVTVALGR